MQLDWISLPITQYAVTAFSMLACLALWLGARMEMRRMRRSMTTSLELIATDFSTVNASIEEVRRSTAAPVPAIPEQQPAAVVSIPVRQGLNLTRRTQILRMKHRGETLQNIASALQIPAGEVSLILKMDSLRAGAAEPDRMEPTPIARGAARGIL